MVYLLNMGGFSMANVGHNQRVIHLKLKTQIEKMWKCLAGFMKSVLKIKRLTFISMLIYICFF